LVRIVMAEDAFIRVARHRRARTNEPVLRDGLFLAR